jgi:hypothetical protein
VPSITPVSVHIGFRGLGSFTISCFLIFGLIVTGGGAGADFFFGEPVTLGFFRGKGIGSTLCAG